MLNRRALFGFLTVAVALTSSSLAIADRYHNRSGLAPGRFVWAPSVAPAGVVTIVVTPGERSLHVYRNGVEIGISTITTAPEAQASSGVFVLTQNKAGGQQGTLSSDLVWRGREIFLGGASHVPKDGIGVSMPNDFAKLLMKATKLGAAVIVAQERSGPQLFSAPGPFIDPVETGSLNRVGRFAQPELGGQLTPPEPSSPLAKGGDGEAAASGAAENGGANESVSVPGQITSLILSRADLSAYVMRDGVLVDRLPITVADPAKPLGLHVGVLVSPADGHHEAKWLAFGLDDDAKAAHVESEGAEQALGRVRFLDKDRSATLARALKAGTVVVLMDGHGPSATQAPGASIALLQSEDAALEASISSSGSSTPQDAPAAAENQAPSVNRARSRAKSRRATLRRRRGPMDNREAWPNSMYWPY